MQSVESVIVKPSGGSNQWEWTESADRGGGINFATFYVPSEGVPYIVWND